MEGHAVASMTPSTGAGNSRSRVSSDPPNARPRTSLHRPRKATADPRRAPKW